MIFKESGADYGTTVSIIFTLSAISPPAGVNILPTKLLIISLVLIDFLH